MGDVRTLFFVTSLFMSVICSIHVPITEVRKFPKYFYFGVATASYQIEGAWNVSGKGENIWDRLVHTHPKEVLDSTNADIACDSYNLFNRDVEMLKELGVDFYRFSISWSRLLPTGFPDSISKDGVNYYNKLIDAMLAKDIVPFVTLYHWDLPQPLQDLGGWTNPLLAEYFEDYARVVFQTFGDRVKMWVTFNEPREFCQEGYGGDTSAPMLNISGVADYMCSHTVLLAHARAYHLYNEEYRTKQRGFIGITLDAYWNEPASDSPEDDEAADRAMQFNFGWFANPIFSRHGDYPEVMRRRIAEHSERQLYPRSRLPAFTKREVRMVKGSSDFLGLNHYSTRLTKLMPDGELSDVPSYMEDRGVHEFYDSSWPGSASSWLKVVPWGFRKVLNWIKDEYNNTPVLITENGFSTRGGLQDADRVNYLNKYLNAVLDAIEDGCDVRGYSTWTLMDNFEWLNGYTERFGLYEVDFSSPNRTRTIRDSGKMYAEVIKTRSITSTVEDCPQCWEEVDPIYRIDALIV